MTTVSVESNAATGIPHDGSAGSLSMQGLAKSFGGLQVFDGISLEVPRDGVMGVIGPNGAGKTTLINVICGMLAPTSGRVMLDGREITGKSFHVVSQLGVVRSFQQTNTFRSATVEENLYRARRFSTSTGDGDLALDELVQEFGLARHMDEPSDKLPYGLQKMLGLVMVLASRPKFLLLDEPAAGLERRERPLVDRFVQHARRHLRCGVLIVEHDMELVRRLCPQIVVLESGRLLAMGTPDEVLSRPEVIDAYLGSSEA
jgi:branched-chain amino acid transport system ATP-binding protein